MGIKSKSTKAQINKSLSDGFRKLENQIILYLHRLGELCLIESRTNKTYQDRTGNLTASMGYIIVVNGQLTSKAGFDEKHGGTVGEALATDIAKDFKTGYALIVVAGMNYASHVEAKGYNVLSSAELLAERQLPIMMNQLRRNIGKIR